MTSRKRKTSIDESKAKRLKEAGDENECPTSVSAPEGSHLSDELCTKALVLIARNKFVTILVSCLSF
jgi:hypothetical protein